MFQKILLAVDLNDADGAARAAAHGGQLAQMCGAELHVMNVLPEYGYNLVGSAFGPDHIKKMLAEAEAALTDWAGSALPEGVAAKVHVAQGTIYDQIIRTADAIGADAIVVGAHRPELKDYLVGPNAARVVRHAKQAVLVIR
jgi:nucleotide-binding universal stress UspA family protein